MWERIVTKLLRSKYILVSKVDQVEMEIEEQEISPNEQKPVLSVQETTTDEQETSTDEQETSTNEQETSLVLSEVEIRHMIEMVGDGCSSRCDISR